MYTYLWIREGCGFVQWIFFAKGITDLEAKGMYAGALIKKRCYWPKGFPGDLIDAHFEDKEVNDVGMIEARNQDNKSFRIFCIKYTDYVMNIMASWLTLHELEGAKTRRDFIDRSRTKETKKFKYRNPFGIHFRYRHQVDGHNNQIHAPLSLESTWANKFWPDRNFSWYLAVSEVNTALASGHFQNYGVVQPILDFCRALAIECLENTIGVEFGDNVKPKRDCKIPVYVPSDKIAVKHYGGMWDPSKKKERSERKISKPALSELLKMRQKYQGLL